MDSNSDLWGAPCEHLVQFYDNDEDFLGVLEQFVADGLTAQEGVVVIATPAHLSALHWRLLKRGPDVYSAMQSDQYLALSAEAMLSIFMVGGWPDDERFNAFVSDILARASVGGRRVRAFGEMVAILWAQGNSSATVRLESLWQNLCEQHQFRLLCAYPKGGFSVESGDSVQHICSSHTRVIA